MAVLDILRKIAADADEEAGKILEQARAEADTIAAQGRAKAEAQREKLEGAARQRAVEERNRIITHAKLSSRRDVLTEKQRLIDRVFEDTRKSIVNMGRDEYQRLIASFLEGAAESAECEIIVDPQETRIDQAFLDRIAAGIDGCTFRMSDERRPIGGGFVLKRGRTETNCTLETILRDARERLESEVAKTLFSS
ncbi:MAG: V-type ATP synthase subunit E [Candidatus Eisenbacteria bacterium]